MKDVGIVVVAIVATVLIVSIAAVVLIALLKRRSRDGRVSLSIQWQDTEAGEFGTEDHSHADSRPEPATDETVNEVRPDEK